MNFSKGEDATMFNTYVRKKINSNRNLQSRRFKNNPIHFFSNLRLYQTLTIYAI